MTGNEATEVKRRAFWIEQLDKADEFMQAIMPYPVEECGEGVVFLPDVAKEAGVTVAFSETPVGGSFKRLFYLRKRLVSHFVGVAKEMNERGWALKVEDGYRSRAIQTALGLQPNTFSIILEKVIWELEGKLPTPEQMFKRLSVLVATCPKLGTHMSASAMDISALDLETGNDIDRGGPYLELSELTPMHCPFISEEAQQNRVEITAIMERHGFGTYPYEFWHYSQGDAYEQYLKKTGKPGRYCAVDIDPETGEVTPIDGIMEPLHSSEKIRSEIEAALERLNEQS